MFSQYTIMYLCVNFVFEELSKDCRKGKNPFTFEIYNHFGQTSGHIANAIIAFVLFSKLDSKCRLLQAVARLSKHN